MAFGTVSTDVIQTSDGASLGAGNASIMKNRIINGAMVIDQRNAGASVTPTTSTYLLDRWQCVNTQASKLSYQTQTSVIPVGFSNAMKITTVSAYSVAAGDYAVYQQQIEGFNVADLNWGTANAKTVTLSFWVQSSLTGVFAGYLTNSTNARSYPFTYTISSANTWQQVSVTILGDTTGTWLTTNGSGIQVGFSLGVGSTYSGTAGSWAATTYLSATGATSVVGTSGATFYITGCQLERGSSATGFEYRQYGQELALCQRYYFKTFPQATAPAQNAGTNGVVSSAQPVITAYNACNLPLPVSMRTTPTVTIYNPSATNAQFRNLTASSDASATSLNVSQSSDRNIAIDATGGSAAGNTIGGHFTASAEL